MDKTLDFQQIPNVQSKLPTILAIVVVAMFAAAYAFACKYIGEQSEQAIVSEIKTLNAPPSLVITEPKVRRGWFSSTYEFTAKLTTVKGIAVGVRAKAHANHLPIPFGTGWGKFVTNDTVIELDDATKKKYESFLTKVPKVLVRTAYHFNRTTTFDVRGFPFQIWSKDNAIEVTKTARISGKLDQTGLLANLSMVIPELFLKDTRRQFSIKNLQIAQRTTHNSVQVNVGNILKADQFEVSQANTTRAILTPVTLKNIAMDFRIKNLSKKALMVMLGTDTAKNTLSLSARAPAFQPTEILNLMKASPELAIEAKRISLTTADGAYDLKGSLTMGGQQLQPGNPFSNLKVQMSINVPVVGVDRLFPTTDSRSTVRRLIRTGWLAKKDKRYVSDVNYEGKKLKINSTQVNPRSLQPFR